MKTKRQFIAIGCLLSVTCLSARGQGTGFTYQGRLNNNGAAVSGTYNVKFALFGTNSGGVAVAGPVTNLVAGVTNGLFTTTIDFGADVFTGNNEWLELGVRTNGNGGFTTLTPRQPVTPTPYAITAENVAGAITVQNNTNNAPNIIGGSSLNYVANGIVGATIGGGGGIDPNPNPNHGAATNSVTANFGTVGGGFGNTASGLYSTVSGGARNIASSPDGSATVGGGFNNTASGDSATVPGGAGNTASGSYSFAAGGGAHAINDYSFVWNGGIAPFSSTADDQFAVQAGGGVRLVGNVTTGDISLSENGAYHNLSMSGGNSTGYLYGSYNNPDLRDGIHLGYNWYSDAAGTGHYINPGGQTARISVQYGEIVLAVGGVQAPPNTYRLDAGQNGVTVYGTFNNSSDRNVKQDFAAVSPSQILEKVLRLPVSEWSYKEDAATRHIGPMGQDFYSVFNIGTDDKHIAPIDEGGIAFAAVQGLNEKVEAGSQRAEGQIKELKAENAELKREVSEIKELLKRLSANKK